MSNDPTREEIERRAYEIYEERGSVPGNDVEHWLEAERQLSAGDAQELDSEPELRHKTAAAGRQSR